jgi:hypothetical protein
MSEIIMEKDINLLCDRIRKYVFSNSMGSLRSMRSNPISENLSASGQETNGINYD